MTPEEETKLGEELTDTWNNLMLRLNIACAELSQEGNMKFALLMESIAEQANMSSRACGIMALGGMAGEELRKGMRQRAEKEKSITH